jgi:hypothetical protein
MSGDVIVAGDHTWVPPNSLREGAFTPNGAHALALGRFHRYVLTLTILNRGQYVTMVRMEL